MCEHEFVFGRINATHCKRCNDTEQEIILREQLAAANARVVELETKRETRPVLYWRNKAEAAEAQCAAMRAVIEYLSMRYSLCVRILPNGAWQVENQDRATCYVAPEGSL